MHRYDTCAPRAGPPALLRCRCRPAGRARRRRAWRVAAHGTRRSARRASAPAPTPSGSRSTRPAAGAAAATTSSPPIVFVVVLGLATTAQVGFFTVGPGAPKPSKSASRERRRQRDPRDVATLAPKSLSENRTWTGTMLINTTKLGHLPERQEGPAGGRELRRSRGVRVLLGPHLPSPHHLRHLRAAVRRPERRRERRPRLHLRPARERAEEHRHGFGHEGGRLPGRHDRDGPRHRDGQPGQPVLHRLQGQRSCPPPATRCSAR